MYDCIVIGKGPAGISAGIYVKRGNKTVLVIGKDGGALDKAEAIDNYYGFIDTISGKDLIENGLRQATRLGVQINTDEVIGVEYDIGKYIVETRNTTYECKTLVLATGTKRSTPKIPGIKELEGKGISYCAVCDAFFYRGKDVTVLGSGDYALKEASTLASVAKSVTILTNGNKLVENRSMQLAENVNINERIIKEVRGNQTLEQIEFTDNSYIDTKGLFVALGMASTTDLARKLGALIENNNIIVDNKMKTNVPGLFACGDCTGGLLQISKAVYEGAQAGLSVIKYLKDL